MQCHGARGPGLGVGRVPTGRGKARGCRLKDAYPHLAGEDPEAEGWAWNFKPCLTDVTAELFPTPSSPPSDSFKQLGISCQEA